MRKKLKSSSEGGDSGRKNANEVTVAPMVGSTGVWVWRESGVKAVGFVLVRFAEIWLQQP
jgi:hypothetical protein